MMRYLHLTDMKKVSNVFNQGIQETIIIKTKQG